MYIIGSIGNGEWKIENGKFLINSVAPTLAWSYFRTNIALCWLKKGSEAKNLFRYVRTLWIGRSNRSNKAALRDFGRF